MTKHAELSNEEYDRLVYGLWRLRTLVAPEDLKKVLMGETGTLLQILGQDVPAEAWESVKITVEEPGTVLTAETPESCEYPEGQRCRNCRHKSRGSDGHPFCQVKDEATGNLLWCEQWKEAKP